LNNHSVVYGGFQNASKIWQWPRGSLDAATAIYARAGCLFALLVHEYKIVDIGPLGLGALERAQAWIEEAQ
jgi:hypothetical protein